MALAHERKGAFDVDGLSEYLLGKEYLQQQKEVLAVLLKDPLFNKDGNYFMGRGERFRLSLAKAKRLAQLGRELGWNQQQDRMADYLLDEATPYGLHKSMFLTILRDQGTDEQHALFLQKAENYEYIGCYAQTELGHGSNVRGLETTATYDAARREFVIHSPTLTASKWWIGSLGRTANFAVVMAQLVVKGKVLGPHPFVVQIRDLKTHQPLPDIRIGDIGPKFGNGYNTMDNGFLRFKQHRIPHVSMLAKYSRIDASSGEYIKPPNAALVYGTMTWVRSNIIMQARLVLARACTVAIRYCAIRRQFEDRDHPNAGKGETPVLDYTTVQVRLLPLLASAFALHFTGRAMHEMYKQSRTSQQSGDFSRLGDVHATSSGLKSLCTTMAGEGIEAARRACGGHGFSQFSGLGQFYADYLPSLTWEGETYILTQQNARYLLKIARVVLAGEAPDNPTARNLQSFLEKKDTGAAFDILGNDHDLVSAFGHRAAYLTLEAQKSRDEDGETWNSLLVDFFRLSNAQSQFLLVQNFLTGLLHDRTRLPPATYEVMVNLFRLFALHTLDNHAAEFFACSATTTRQLILARKRVMKLLSAIRPYAVLLVDAFAFPDYLLDSSLGRYDGKVYEDLFHRASELNPLNKLTVDASVDSPVVIRGEGPQPLLEQSMKGSKAGNAMRSKM